MGKKDSTYYCRFCNKIVESSNFSVRFAMCNDCLEFKRELEERISKGEFFPKTKQNEYSRLRNKVLRRKKY